MAPHMDNSHIERSDAGLVPVHISQPEIVSLNVLQHGQVVDEKTGLRSYRKLSKILKKKKNLDILVSMTEFMKTGEDLPPDISQMIDQMLEKVPAEFVPIESDSDPEIHQLSETGEHEDKYLVLFPKDVVEILDFLRGEDTPDPTLGLDQFWGFLAPLAMVAMAAGSGWMGHKAEKARGNEDSRRHGQDMEEIRRAREQEMGKWSSPLKIEYHKPHKKGGQIRKYKVGGKVIGVEIKGKGTGQSDDIPRNAKENSWVWDATTVAHAGDGTTNAGQKAIENFEKTIAKTKLPEVKEVIKETIKSKPLRIVPCALSNGERVTPPELVAAAGDGDFDKGSSILRKMTKELRRHKASKGLNLPPSAHDLMIYYKKARGGK